MISNDGLTCILGLFEGLQKVVSPTKQKSRALPTPATESAQLATEEDCAGATQCSDEPLDESSRISETKLAKNKKDRIRRKKRAAATSTRGFMECYSTTYPGFSLVHGWKTNSSSSSETLEEESPTPTQKGEDSINLTEGQWNVFEIPLPCSREGCLNQCSFMDGSTVICPACGPFSLVRYCGKQHLWEDVLDHWIRCRCYPLLHKFGISSIPKEIFMGPPILHNFHQWDRPERHRQAVWFSSAASYGDYFVFMNNDYPPNSVYQSAGSEGPVYPMGANVACWFKKPQEKDRIRRVLAVCLFCKLTPSFSRYFWLSFPSLLSSVHNSFLFRHCLFVIIFWTILIHQPRPNPKLMTFFLLSGTPASSHRRLFVSPSPGLVHQPWLAQ